MDHTKARDISLSADQIQVQNAKSPAARHFHSLVAHQGDLYLFGGLGSNAQPLNDLWKFSTGKLFKYYLHLRERNAKPNMSYKSSNFTLNINLLGENNWKQIKTHNAPKPRHSHQAVVLRVIIIINHLN